MSAKTELFTRLEYLEEAIKNPALIDNGIAVSAHNGAANLLRKGLCIVAFNILEDFIKNKTIETMNSISHSGIIFTLLSKKLQEAATLGALDALKFRAKMEKRNSEDWRILIKDETLKIHSTLNGSNFELSQFSLLSSGSNISKGEIPLAMSAFSIDHGWNKLKSVSDAINGGVLDLSQSYENASSRRHSSAHSVNYSYQYSWLEGIKKEILSISASFDLLLTARYRQIKRNPTVNVSTHNIDDDLKYRFLKEKSIGGNIVFQELTQINGRSRKNWTDLTLAINTLKPNLEHKKEFLIILDSSSSLSNWYYE